MKEKVYDFIIIGGGPAGSTAATNLARKGFDVLVLEKEKFPRFHVGESLMPFCYQIFQELGVLEIMEKEFLRKPGATFSNLDNSRFSHWCFSNVIKNPSHLSFHVSRDRFDQILLDNSRSAGAEVREETKVTNVDFVLDQSKVVVHTSSAFGNDISYTGRFLLDASGQDTFTGKKLGTKQQHPRFSKRIAYYSHWVNLQADEPLDKGNIRIVALEGERKGWVFVVPIDKARTSLGVVLDMDYTKKQRANHNSGSSKDWIDTFYKSELASSPFLTQLTVGAEMVEPVRVTGDYCYTISEKFSKQYALIGDAATFLDPIFSSGVFLAMKSAMLVSSSAAEFLQTRELKVLEDTYQSMVGGYRVVEELIATFYTPNAIRFSDTDQHTDYDNFESTYSILHLILAGDLFQQHEKYLKAINKLRDEKALKRYKNLVNVKDKEVKEMCKGATHL